MGFDDTAHIDRGTDDTVSQAVGLGSWVSHAKILGDLGVLAVHSLESLMDVVVLVALLLSFAVLCTAHVALCVGLVLERPRYRGALALIVPPLAPYWGMERGMKRRAGLWVAALTVYVLARIVAEI